MSSDAVRTRVCLTSRASAPSSVPICRRDGLIWRAGLSCRRSLCTWPSRAVWRRVHTRAKAPPLLGFNASRRCPSQQVAPRSRINKSGQVRT